MSVRLRLGSLLRAGRRRGHGVHSPFVYALTRKVLRSRTIPNEDTHIYNKLCAEGVSRRYARELQNLYQHCYCEYKVEFILPAQQVEIVTPNEKTILCIVGHNRTAERRKTCTNLVDQHCGTTIDKLGYMIVVFDSALPKQNFKL